MTEPLTSEREAGMAAMFGRGAEGLEDHESDESLDALDAQPEDQRDGPELAVDYSGYAEPEPEPVEEEGYEEDDVLDRVASSFDEDEPGQDFQITELEHQQAVDLASLQAQLDAAEAQVLPPEFEESEETQPINFLSEEVVNVLADRLEIDPSKAGELSSILGTYAEAAAKNLYGPQIEALEQQNVDAAEMSEAEQAYTEVQRNLEQGFFEAGEFGDDEASVVRDWQERGQDSFLYPYFERNPHSMTTSEGVLNAVRIVASDLLELDRLNQELGYDNGTEVEGENDVDSLETADGALVGRRSEVQGIMNRAVRNGDGASQRPQESVEEQLFRALEAERPNGDRLGAFWD